MAILFAFSLNGRTSGEWVLRMAPEKNKYENKNKIK